MISDFDNESLDGIAVIGMAGQFPGAKDVFQLWENLCAGVESIRFFSEDELDPTIPEEKKKDPNYIKARGIIDNVDCFDARFFGLNAQEAEIMDPQNRIFLQLAWHALENSGYVPDDFTGLIGVFAGMGNTTYYTKNVLTRPDKVSAIGEFQAQIANEKDYLSTRVSYKLNLKGPSLSINTACSTSLVAISYACDSLLNYQCDMALAGGVSITLPQHSGYMYQEVNIFSKDGHCRPFDSKASGTVSGNGAGIVVLKRLEDAMKDQDLIYGVIKGTAVNNDGSSKMSYMAPSVDGQADVISMALANAEMDPTDISYIETHGTATTIGDPIEFEALKQAYGSGHDLKGFCGIGSIKSNIGHLDTAAGVAGLIKTVLSLYHGKIPPSINYESPNFRINFKDSPFYVCDRFLDWPNQDKPRRAAVSSFGVGGTNAHAIIEQSPELTVSGPSRPVQLFALSARTAMSLDGAAENLISFLTKNQDLNLADAAYILQTGRKKFNHRKAIVCEGMAGLMANPYDRVFDSAGFVDAVKSELVFMFPGQGSQYVNMGLSFYQHEPLFRDIVDKCSTCLEPLLGLDIRKIIFPGDSASQSASDDLQKTCYNQPAIFIVEYALSKLLESWGIQPSFMIGHSIGEYVAATISGVFSLEDALEIVAARGRLMHEMPSGTMLSVYVPGEMIVARLPENLSLAAVNAPSFSVVSGKTEDIEGFMQTLLKEGINCKALKTSHAFHSIMMEPVVEPFRKIIEKVSLSKPSIPFVSSMTGEWIRNEQATDPMYWASHLRHSVLFSKAVKTLEEKQCQLMLEVGPRSTLSFLVQEHYPLITKKTIMPVLGATNNNQAEWIATLSAIGQLWTAGVDIDWKGFYQYETRKKCSLPGYCFEKQSYWIEPARGLVDSGDARKGPLGQNDKHGVFNTGIRTPDCQDNKEQAAILNIDIENILAGIWKNVIPEVKTIEHSDNFFELGGHSLLAVQFFSEIKRKTGIDLHLATLFEAPTFGALLDILQREMNEKKQSMDNRDAHQGSGLGQSTWRALVGIKPQGNRPPFFCVHGIGGNVLNYVPLATFVDDDQPFYGLQAQGIDGILEPFQSIEEMAKRYVAEIRLVQPKGPYYLGGGSMGGLIAFEMAQQLQQAGEHIGLLAMFDTYGPGSTNVFFKNNIKTNKNLIWGKIFLYLEKIRPLPLAEKFLHVKRSIGFHINYRKNMIMVKVFRMIKKPLPHSLRYWYVEQKNDLLSRSYRVKEYKGRVLLFRATAEKQKIGFDPFNGWGGMAEDGIEIIEIPGNHENIVEHPLLGECLAESLKKTQAPENGC